jgi:hypothetical protein
MKETKKKKGKGIPFIFNDESTGSYICLRLNIHVTHIVMRIGYIF